MLQCRDVLNSFVAHITFLLLGGAQDIILVDSIFLFEPIGHISVRVGQGMVRRNLSAWRRK